MLLELPNLRALGIPLRRNYRKQVFALAEHSAAFAAVAAHYESLDAMRARSADPRGGAT